MISALALPAALWAQLEKEARNALPNECCGLIEGKIEGRAARAQVLHPMRNIAFAFDSFAIDPAAHMALRRQLRARSRVVIGCYHSHPDGLCEPSARDREQGGEEDFLWLIAACSGQSIELGAFVFDGGAFLPVPLEAER